MSAITFRRPGMCLAFRTTCLRLHHHSSRHRRAQREPDLTLPSLLMYATTVVLSVATRTTFPCTRCWNLFRASKTEVFRSVQKFNALNSTPVSRHFTQPKHSVKNMEFSIVQWMGWGWTTNPDSSTKRKRQELFYIWAFPTLHSMGINIFVRVYALLLHP